MGQSAFPEQLKAGIDGARMRAQGHGLVGGVFRGALGLEIRAGTAAFSVFGNVSRMRK